MNDENALSPLVGVALILVSVISIVAIYQTQTVPALFREQEWEHYLFVKEKFESLAEKSELASKSGGFVVINFPLQLKYEGLSFAPLVPSAGCTIKAENIGVVNVTYGDGSSISFDLVALKLVPRYNYLRVDDEIFVLGTYFTSSGKPLKVSGERRLIILDANFDEISGDGRLKFGVLPLIGSLGGNVKVEVRSNESWLLNYLKNEFGANVVQNVATFNLTSIELVVIYTSENVEDKLEEERMGAESMIFNVSVSGNGESVRIEVKSGNGNGNGQLINGGEVEIEFENHLVESVLLYVSGYTSYFNEKVNVTLTYCEKYNDGVCTDTLFSQTFDWSTLSNGYLQIPIEVPRKFGNRGVEAVIVSFEFPSEQNSETFSFKIIEKG